jgi:hypothetical protein
MFLIYRYGETLLQFGPSYQLPTAQEITVMNVMWWTRMREVLWGRTSTYYPLLKVPHTALAHYILLEVFDVWSLCVLLKLSVAPTNSRPVVPRTASSLPHRTRHAYTDAVITSCGSKSRFPQPLQLLDDIGSELNHDRFLLHPFSSYHFYHSTLCSLRYPQRRKIKHICNKTELDKYDTLLHWAARSGNQVTHSQGFRYIFFSVCSNNTEF